MGVGYQNAGRPKRRRHYERLTRAAISPFASALYRLISVKVCAGQSVGIKTDQRIWLVSFMDFDLGYFDLKQKACNPSTTRSARG